VNAETGIILAADLFNQATDAPLLPAHI